MKEFSILQAEHLLLQGKMNRFCLKTLVLRLQNWIAQEAVGPLVERERDRDKQTERH